ncbi:DNA repair protein RAD57 [Rhodotorula taiwanensis]|uniref:DNA repair protein RAD57 n=1 Tax=Rhodotorula taiwanensis TaxID=741276 RepID=A0A2S5BF54_9BASI|nr:DNA repair protein RAD57 [Rhodotorula taiwanensis]
MHQVELARLGPASLTSKQRSYLVKAQLVYASQVLLSSPSQLARRIKLPIAECHQLINQLARAVLTLDADAARWSSLDSTTLDDAASFTTGDPELDSFFDAHPRGGIRIGAITEVAGQSSSGKTNLALQLACTVQLPLERGGQRGGALFLSSEGTFPSRRLAQLARHYSEEDNGGDLAWTETDFLDNVHVEAAPDAESLLALLAYHVPAAIERIAAAAAHAHAHEPSERAPPLPIRLLILDSIAAPFRSAHETGSTGFAQRAKEFAELGDELKSIAARYRVAVVVVNQVSDVWDARGRDLPPSFLQPVMTTLDDHAGEQGAVSAVPPPHLRTFSTSTFPPPTTLANAPPNSTSANGNAHTNGNGGTSSGNGNGNGNGAFFPPAPHQQYNFPPLLYSRFQSPHVTGAFSSVSHPTLLPLPPAFRGGGGGGGPGAGSASSTQPVAAALGHTWSHIPTTRILCLVRRRESSALLYPGGGGTNSGSARTRRCMTLVWSPFAPRGCVEYEIDELSGVRAVGQVRVRAVPGFESYDDDAQDEDEDEDEGLPDPRSEDRGARPSEDERRRWRQGATRRDPSATRDGQDDERQYWGSTEDLLLVDDELEVVADLETATAGAVAVTAAGGRVELPPPSRDPPTRG